MTNLWFLGTVYFQREDRIFSARGLYIFNIWGPYIFADRIFSAKWPYIFSDRTVYFQRLGTVYFRRPYILSRGPYIFSSRTVYFQPSGPYIFSLDRIFHVWPLIWYDFVQNWLKNIIHCYKGSGLILVSPPSKWINARNEPRIVQKGPTGNLWSTISIWDFWKLNLILSYLTNLMKSAETWILMIL